ncbi:MAG: ATP-binding protein [Candidatus Eiseniibacteriota bacterium]
MTDRLKNPERAWWPALPAAPQSERGVAPYVLGAAAAGMVALVCTVLKDWLSNADSTMLMLIPVLWSSVRFGFWPSFVTAVIGALTANYFLFQPHFAFGFLSIGDFITLTVYVLTAAVTSYWAGRAKREAELAGRRERDTALLYNLHRKMAATPRAEALPEAAATEIARIRHAGVVLLLGAPGALKSVAEYGLAEPLDAREMRAAEAARRSGRPAGAGAEHEVGARLLYLPLRAGAEPLGVIGFAPGPGEPPGTLKPEGLLTTIASQIAIALERALMAEEMTEARALAQTEKLRAALLSSISHDFRTPLASIIGSASSLLETGAQFSPEARRDLLLTIQQSGERLHRYVVNLLDMSRLEAGALTLKRDWVELGDLIGTALARMEGELEHHRVTLDLPRDLPMLDADFVLIEQVLLNLLDNAAKYSPPGSTIAIAARDEGDAIALEIANPCEALPAGETERIFTKFYRLNDSSDTKGTGLGLSICKGFVEAHGGTIAAHPTADGAGMVVVVRLPVTADARAFRREALVDE